MQAVQADCNLRVAREVCDHVSIAMRILQQLWTFQELITEREGHRLDCIPSKQCNTPFFHLHLSICMSQEHCMLADIEVLNHRLLPKIPIRCIHELDATSIPRWELYSICVLIKTSTFQVNLDLCGN